MNLFINPGGVEVDSQGGFSPWENDDQSRATPQRGGG